MPADALATLGVGASAGMVLTPKDGIVCLQHHKSYIEIRAPAQYKDVILPV